MSSKIEELMQKDFWIIDILPLQVPKDSRGQYFAIEEYYLNQKQFPAIKQKQINLVLKLNCYRDMFIDGEEIVNPSPEHIADVMRTKYANIVIGETLICSEPDDIHMTLYNPDVEMLRLIRKMTIGEGLYLWKPAK